MTASPDKARKYVALNRRALHDYLVLSKVEAGVDLRGTEVKSIRGGQMSLAGGFARVEKDEVILRNVTIPAYEHGGVFNHEPERPRRLLLHRREIENLRVQTEQKGCAVVPLSAYLHRGFVKISLGICRGKRQEDKRETLRRRTALREAERDMARATRR
jgi:SsrA-binding protein